MEEDNSENGNLSTTLENVSSLINITEFRRNASDLFQTQISDPFTNVVDKPELKLDLARKCNVDEQLKYSTQLFADPTLFSLLRQHHEKLLANNYAANTPLSTLFDQKSKISNSNPPLYKDQSGSEQSKSRKTHRFSSPQSSRDYRSASNASTITKHSEMSDSTLDLEQSENQTQDSAQTSSVGSFLPSDTSSDEDSLSQMNSGPPVSNNSGLQLPRSLMLPPASSQISSTTSHSSNGESDTDQRDDSPAPPPSTPMEVKLRSMAVMLEKSTLATLKEINRVTIPPKKRSEVNFLAGTNKKEHMAVDLITDTEVVLSVAFYHKNKATTRMQEFLVLSSQPLTVLRDAFYCLSDFLTVENDEEVVNTQTKKVSSSYFFIENTFYSDMRSPSAVDYSKVILDWVEENEQPDQAKYQKRVMGEVKFSDLSIRINQPYLFTHQGDCQHIFKFRDIRLLTKSDDHNRNAYPKPIFQCKITRHKCRMCYMYPAEYVTINDFHSGETPCYFCEHCYEPFHYDSQGRLLYEYQVFPYAHD